MRAWFSPSSSNSFWWLLRWRPWNSLFSPMASENVCLSVFFSPGGGFPGLRERGVAFFSEAVKRRRRGWSRKSKQRLKRARTEKANDPREGKKKLSHLEEDEDFTKTATVWSCLNSRGRTNTQGEGRLRFSKVSAAHSVKAEDKGRIFITLVKCWLLQLLVLVQVNGC